MTIRKLATAAVLALSAMTAAAQVSPFVVTNANDSGIGSLRDAITAGNGSCLSAVTNPTITFALTGTGPFTIQPATELPAIACPMTIDGYSQPGATANTDTGGSSNANLLIILNGSACAGGASPCAGLRSIASGVFIKGLSIHSFAGSGVSVDGGYAQIYGNYIGTDPGGMNPFPNGGAGIDGTGGQVYAGSGGPGDVNLITANAGPGIRTTASGTGAYINDNLIGGQRNGGSGMGNGGAGVELNDPFTHRINGSYIRYNGGAGILVNAGSVAAPGNPSIFGNGDRGIKYVAPAPYPAPKVTAYLFDSISNTTSVTVQMSGGPASSSFNNLDLYGNSSLPPFGEGQQLISTALNFTLDASGSATATFTLSGKVDNPTAVFSYCGDGCLDSTEFSVPIFPPNLALTFSPGVIPLGSSGTIAMQLSNPNKTGTMSLVGFSFTLPSGLTIGPESAQTDCAPGFSVSGASSTVAAVSNVTLAANGTCTITATLTPTAGGTYNFPAGTIPVASDAGQGTNSAATVTVTATPGLSVTPGSLSFGTIRTGTSASQTVTVQSNGTAPLDVTGASVTGAGFTVTGNTCTTGMVAPATCTITVTFSPTAVQAYSATLDIFSNGSPSPLAVGLTGAGGAPGLQFTPATVTFARQNVGTTSTPQSVTLTNTGSTSLNISSIAITGDFGYTGCGFPLTLAPGASCTFSITFSPQANGTLTGAISVTSNGPGSPNVLPLTGTGANGPAPGISVQPFSLGLGPVRVGNSATDHVTIFSVGTAPLSLSGISLSGAFFSQTNSCPSSLPVGASCDVTITYSPTAVGTHAGSLTIASNGDPPTLNVGLSGSAVAQLPPILSVAGSLDFGQQLVGSTTRHALDLRNTGEQTLNVTGLNVQNLQGAAFRLEGSCASIAGGGTCTVTIVFEPTAVSAYASTLRITSNDSRGTVPVSLTGQGVLAPRPEISIVPDGIGFANQMMLTASAGQAITIKSTGNAPLTLRGIAATAPFAVAGNTCGATLAPGAECQVSVTFVPVAPGFVAGRLNVDSDAAAGRDFASLTGTGCRFYSVPGMRGLQRLCAP